MDLVLLAPTIQESVLIGQGGAGERRLREAVQEAEWVEQRSQQELLG